jgi:very-short-patch-repair endonuclease/uncharacterized Zn finger protein (UPF0148 family)
MLKFKCENCKKILWRTYALKDGKTICTECHRSFRNEEIEMELKQKEIDKRLRIKEIEKEKIEKEKQKIERNIKIDKFYNEIFEKGIHEIIYNFIKKYPGDTDKKFDTLIKLIEVKHGINVDRDIFKDVIWRVKDIYEERKEIDALERELISNKKDLREEYFCEICKKGIDEKTFYYSKYIFNKSLCLEHQGAKTQKELFIALKNRDLDCEYESWDGYKHIDIAIHDAKLYIEIDGKHHLTNQKQFFNDLKRDYFSIEDGYLTRRIGNEDIEKNLEDIANSITELVNEKYKN